MLKILVPQLNKPTINRNIKLSRKADYHEALKGLNNNETQIDDLTMIATGDTVEPACLKLWK